LYPPLGALHSGGDGGSGRTQGRNASRGRNEPLRGARAGWGAYSRRSQDQLILSWCLDPPSTCRSTFYKPSSSSSSSALGVHLSVHCVSFELSFLLLGVLLVHYVNTQYHPCSVPAIWYLTGCLQCPPSTVIGALRCCWGVPDTSATEAVVCVCVCVCVCALVRMHNRTCVCVCVCARARARVHVRMHNRTCVYKHMPGRTMAKNKTVSDLVILIAPGPDQRA
jgi:hypothetical protein